MSEQKPPLMGKRRAVFKPDHKSFGEFIRSDQMRKVTTEVAHDVGKLAGDYAPRRKSRGEAPEGTEMADSFHVNPEAGFLKVGRNVRVKVEVFNEKRSAAPNEFGRKTEDGERVQRHRMLGRAGAEFGDMWGGREEW